MPSGESHNKINIVALPLILFGVYLLIQKYNLVFLDKYFNLKYIAIFSISYFFGTYYLSPDLDIKSSIHKRWGIFRYLWLPYRLMFKHRGKSHHPIFGPLSIIVTFLIILSPIFIFMKISLNEIPFDIVIVIISGIVLSIELHIISDNLVSKFKKRKH